MPPKRKHLTLAQKKQLIADNDAGSSIDDLKQKYDIGKATVYKIINDRNSILEQIDDGGDPKRKNMKLDENPVNDATLSWFKVQRSKNVPISGQLLQVGYF